MSRFGNLSIDFDPDDDPVGETLGKVLDEGLSLTVRPGALSYDYLTSYTIGPVQQGDFSLGLADRIWQVRIYNQSVRLARQNNNRSEFESETLLTTLPFNPVEGDAAFDQSARAFVCMEFQSHIWFYWYNSSLGVFEVKDFGPGRSPRCTLDQLSNRPDSDLHVFYIANGFLRYRVQRENYAVERSTGYATTDDSYVEDAAITKGDRIVVLMSNRDINGHYSFERTYSILLPISLIAESVFEGLAPQLGILLVLLQTVAPLVDGANFVDDVEQYHEGLTVQSGLLVTPIILHALYDIEQYHEGLTVQSGLLVVVVVTNVLFDIEQYHEGLTVQSGLLVVIVITHVLFDIEQYHEGLTVISGTLV